MEIKQEEKGWFLEQEGREGEREGGVRGGATSTAKMPASGSAVTSAVASAAEMSFSDSSEQEHLPRRVSQSVVEKVQSTGGA